MEEHSIKAVVGGRDLCQRGLAHFAVYIFLYLTQLFSDLTRDLSINNARTTSAYLSFQRHTQPATTAR